MRAPVARVICTLITIPVLLILQNYTYVFNCFLEATNRISNVINYLGDNIDRIERILIDRLVDCRIFQGIRRDRFSLFAIIKSSFPPPSKLFSIGAHKSVIAGTKMFTLFPRRNVCVMAQFRPYKFLGIWMASFLLS